MNINDSTRVRNGKIKLDGREFSYVAFANALTGRGWDIAFVIYNRFGTIHDSFSRLVMYDGDAFMKCSSALKEALREYKECRIEIA